MPSLEISQMRSLLRMRADNPEVRSRIAIDPGSIGRHAYAGTAVFKAEGYEVAYAEAPWVLASEVITDPAALHVRGFHMHRQGHDGFAQFGGALPRGVAFGESKASVLSKMGPPGAVSRCVDQGGAVGASWIRYSLGDADVQFQFGTDDGLELVSLHVPLGESRKA